VYKLSISFNLCHRERQYQLDNQYYIVLFFRFPKPSNVKICITKDNLGLLDLKILENNRLKNVYTLKKTTVANTTGNCFQAIYKGVR